MAASLDVQAGVIEKFLKQFLDGFGQARPLFRAWEKAGGIQQGGGSSLVIPLQLEKHSTITGLITGKERIDISTRGIAARGTNEWCRIAAPITVSGKDKTAWSSTQAQFNMLEKLTRNVVDEMFRALEKKIKANLDPTSVLTELMTLNGTSTAEGLGSSTGVFEAKEFGSQTNTVQRVSKSSHTESYQHQFGDVADDASENLRAKMEHVANRCKYFSPTGDLPDLILASEASYENFAALLTANELISSDINKQNTGSQNLLFKGIPVVHSLDMPTLGTTELSMYFLDLKTLTIQKNFLGEMSDWKRFDEYDAEGCHVISELQVAAEHLPSQGVIVRAEVFGA